MVSTLTHPTQRGRRRKDNSKHVDALNTQTRARDAGVRSRPDSIRSIGCTDTVARATREAYAWRKAASLPDTLGGMRECYRLPASEPSCGELDNASAQDRVLVVAGGVTVAEALSAHDELAATGIAIRVIDIFSVQPADGDAPVAAARACGGVCGRGNHSRSPLRAPCNWRHGAGGARYRALRGAQAGRARNPAQRQAERTSRPLRYFGASHRRGGESGTRVSRDPEAASARRALKRG